MKMWEQSSVNGLFHPWAWDSTAIYFFFLLVGTDSWLRCGWHGRADGHDEVVLYPPVQVTMSLVSLPFSIMPCKICVPLYGWGVKSKGWYFRRLFSCYEYCQIMVILFIVARGTTLPVAVEKVWVLNLWWELFLTLQTSFWGRLLCKEVKFMDKSL